MIWLPKFNSRERDNMVGWRVHRRRRVVGLFLCIALVALVVVPRILHTVLSSEQMHNLMGQTLSRLQGFHSQWGQDRWVADYLMRKGGATGQFVEFGANDGLSHSNTAYFEKRLGYTGLCIEPFRDNYEKLVRNRPNCHSVHAAVGLCPTGAERTFIIVGPENGDKNGDGSGFNGWEDTYDPTRLSMVSDRITRIQMPCRNLNDVMKQNGMRAVDYMSVDTEGSELEVLGDLNWDLYHPTVVQIEVNRLFHFGVAQPYSAKEEGLRKLMTAHRYHLERIFTSGLDTRKHSAIEKAHDLIFVRQ